MMQADTAPIPVNDVEPALRPLPTYLRSLAGSVASAASFVLPLLGTVLFVINCLGVARFNGQIALDVINLSSPVDVLKPILINTVELGIMLGGGLAVACAYEEYVVGKRRWYLLTVFGWLTIVSAVLSVLFSIPDQGLVVGIIMGISSPFLIAAVVLLPREAFRAGVKPNRSLAAKIGGAAIVVALPALFLIGFLNIAGNQMWLPAESIQQQGAQPRLQYVLRDDDDDLVVFDAKRAVVIRLAKSSVKSRVYCATSDPTRGLPYCPGTTAPSK